MQLSSETSLSNVVLHNCFNTYIQFKFIISKDTNQTRTQSFLVQAVRPPGCGIICDYFRCKLTDSPALILKDIGLVDVVVKTEM